MENWVSYLGIFGLGSVITALVQWIMQRADDKKKMQFDEKREAYLGLLDAYRQAATTNSHDARMSFAYWKLRCRLVAPKGVLEVIDKFSDSEPNSEEMKDAEKALIKEFRNDLGVSEQ